MILINEISRIKSLLYENHVLETFELSGDVNDPYGIKIILKKGDDYLGHVHFVNFDLGWHFEEEIRKMYENYDNICKSGLEKNFFNNKNSVYLFDLEVKENHRGKGYGSLLFEKSNDLCKKINSPFIVLITDQKNHIARNLYEKNNYKVHLADNKKIFYYKEM